MTTRRKAKVALAIGAVILTVIIFLSTFQLSSAQTFASAGNSGEGEAKKGVPLTILMYHELSNRKCSEHILSPAAFEQDLKYIADNNYTSIVMQDIFNYLDCGIALPEKPVMITFDDGGKTDYTQAFPLLKKYNTKAVISVVGHYLERQYNEKGELNGVYNNSLTYDMMTEMQQSGLIEFQNHTYKLHSFVERKGMRNTKGECLEKYENLLKEDLYKVDALLQEKLNIKLNTITFPYGSYSKDTITTIKKLGYRASLTCNEGTNYITPDTNLFLLKRYNRNPSRNAQKILG